VRGARHAAHPGAAAAARLHRPRGAGPHPGAAQRPHGRTATVGLVIVLALLAGWRAHWLSVSRSSCEISAQPPHAVTMPAKGKRKRAAPKAAAKAPAAVEAPAAEVAPAPEAEVEGEDLTTDYEQYRMQL